MQDHNHKKSGWGVMVFVVMLLIVSPILYVLSIGPAAWFFTQTLWEGETYGIIYAPIIWFIENSSYEEELVEWYFWYLSFFVDV